MAKGQRRVWTENKTKTEWWKMNLRENYWTIASNWGIILNHQQWQTMLLANNWTPRTASRTTL